MTARQAPAAPGPSAGGGVPDAPLAAPLTRLTRKEGELLEFLRAHPGQVFTRRELLAAVWGVGADQRTRTVDQHIAALRRKCGLQEQLLTVCRRGYLYRAG